MIILDKRPALPDVNFPEEVSTVDKLCKNVGDQSKVLSIQATISPEEVAIVFPTSGSTGDPKFATYTHFSYINGLKILNIKIPFDEAGSVFLNDRPFSWAGGLVHLPVVNQTTMVFPGIGGFDQVYKAIAEEKATVALMLAYMLYDAMKAKAENIEAPTSLKYVITGGERIPAELMEYARLEFKVVLMLYASTEFKFPCSGSISAEGSIDTGALTTMRCHPHYEIKITGADGKVIPRGEPGEIWVRSVCSMTGYLMDPEATSRNKQADGWITPGDIA